MRPYFAIVKDSFREAWRSWALWVVLVLITIFLLLLAPVGASRDAVVGLTLAELFNHDGPLFVVELAAAAEAEEPSPAKAIYDRLDEETQKDVLQAAAEFVASGDLDPGSGGGGDPERMRVVLEVRSQLDRMLREPGFFEAEDWRGVNLRAEAMELKAQGLENLEPDRVARFNRVALESAYPGVFFRTPPRGYVFSYLVWDLNPDSALPMTEEEFEQSVAYVFRTAMNWGFGSLGILIALIVTAPMVPQTFDPGSLNLLLSKPIVRFGALLAKFVGGCAFVTLCVGWLIVGLTLLLGLRLGVWEWKYLYYIPMFVFVFAIYHSVSVAAGVLFRSTIVSIAVVFLFWLTCFALGWAIFAIEGFAVTPRSATDLLRSDGQTFAVTRTGAVFRRNEATDEWERMFRATDDPPLLRVDWRQGPTYDASRDALFAQRSFGFQVDQMLSYATRAGGWRRATGPNIGVESQAMIYRPESTVGEGDAAETVPPALLFVGPDGPMELREDPLEEKDDSPLSFLSRFTGASPFRDLVDEPLELDLPIYVALHEASGDLAIYSEGMLVWLSLQEDGSYVETLREKLEGDAEARVSFDVGGPKEAPLVAIAREDGSIQPLRVTRGESPKVEALSAFSPEGDSLPRTVRVRPDGSQIATLFHVGTLWIRDVESGTLRKPWITGQGSLTAAEWFGDDALAVADSRTRIRVLEADGYATRETIDMESTFWVSLYRWAAHPLYTIFPKPGEIDRTMTWILTGEETQALDALAQFAPGLDKGSRAKLDPYEPIWSGLLFIGVLLGLAGWRFSRQEY